MIWHVKNTNSVVRVCSIKHNSADYNDYDQTEAARGTMSGAGPEFLERGRGSNQPRVDILPDFS